MPSNTTFQHPHLVQQCLLWIEQWSELMESNAHLDPERIDVAHFNPWGWSIQEKLPQASVEDWHQSMVQAIQERLQAEPAFVMFANEFKRDWRRVLSARWSVDRKICRWLWAVPVAGDLEEMESGLQEKAWIHQVAVYIATVLNGVPVQFNLSPQWMSVGHLASLGIMGDESVMTLLEQLKNEAGKQVKLDDRVPAHRTFLELVNHRALYVERTALFCMQLYLDVSRLSLIEKESLMAWTLGRVSDERMTILENVEQAWQEKITSLGWNVRSHMATPMPVMESFAEGLGLSLLSFRMMGLPSVTWNDYSQLQENALMPLAGAVVDLDHQQNRGSFRLEMTSGLENLQMIYPMAWLQQMSSSVLHSLSTRLLGLQMEMEQQVDEDPVWEAEFQTVQWRLFPPPRWLPSRSLH